MIETTESLNQNRKKMLIGFTFGFGIWWGARTLVSLFPELGNSPNLSVFAALIGLAGWGYMAIYQIRIIKMSKKIKQNPAFNQALNDELYEHIRLKSLKSAFIILLVAQFFLLPVNMFYGLSAESVININIFTGVISPVVSFIFFDSE
jgi:sulfite exporter TauE/SafE